MQKPLLSPPASAPSSTSSGTARTPGQRSLHFGAAVSGSNRRTSGHFFTARAAVSHLFRVVAGLDSLIVGENQARQRASDERHIQLGVFRDVERPTLNEHLDHAQQVSQESGPVKITDLLRQFG
ncbi:MAG: hypothetical protein IH846_18880 [Acidobacteria bacterium]|nr:hypothetical protein [Acidobacteriota bacterium]